MLALLSPFNIDTVDTDIDTVSVLISVGIATALISRFWLPTAKLPATVMQPRPTAPVDYDKGIYPLTCEVDSIKLMMSDASHTVTLGPSFVGAGNLPLFTPAHQVLFDTGITAGIGGSVLESPRICGSRT
jgi:hypothetical protein